MTDSDSSAAPTKQSLRSWWSKFTSKASPPNRTSASLMTPSSSSTGALAGNPDGVFGVSLARSLRYASVAISMMGTDGKARIYGFVPIIVAKCGLFLKDNGAFIPRLGLLLVSLFSSRYGNVATTTQGIFRVSGSSKRINDLMKIFDSPPK
jgi:hypothetical protein